MIKAIADTRHMTRRHVMELLRQPWWIFVNLVQPVIWLLLFGALFESVTNIPGFGSADYIQFLAPGVVVMTAFFTAGWSGMPMIEDLERGVVDRFLVSPVRRSSLITGRLANAALQIVVQTTIIMGLALATGAQFSNGIVGVLVLTAVAILLGASFGALSNGLALLARREETLIALMQFLMLPLSFLSVTFMQKDLMPGWMQTASGFNPVNWAVEAGREALTASTDWGLVASRAGMLAAFMTACLFFAVRAFRAYQRSI
jgi:ABC-2 type transport system permease protein